MNIKKEKYFFTIPIYRLSQELYYKEIEGYVEDQIQLGVKLNPAFMKKFYKNNPDIRFLQDQHLRGHYGCWEFNEIIGYICLYFFGNQIRGEYWYVTSKRIRRTRKKIFKFQQDLTSEIDIPVNAGSPDIFKSLLEYLDDCKKELKGRYIDTSILDVIGPHTDWRALYEEYRNLKHFA